MLITAAHKISKTIEAAKLEEMAVSSYTILKSAIHSLASKEQKRERKNRSVAPSTQ
jgi:hypothetical protein